MHHITCFDITRQLLIGMQLLTGASYHFFRYNTTTADWDSIKNSIDTPDVTFTRLTAANLYYGLFEKLVEGFSPPSISDIPENPVELMAADGYFALG